MINKQRKPRPSSFRWGRGSCLLSYFYKETKNLFYDCNQPTDETSNKCKVLFFKTFQLYNTDGALFNFY